MIKKLLAVLLVLAVLPAGAFACTAIYAGSALTDDGSTVFARLEHIAMENEEAAVCIRERMDALQDQICSSGETGNKAAETAWQSALKLLEEFD